MPEKERLTPTELLTRRRNFTRMSKSNLGKRLRVPNPSETNPTVTPAQFTQFGGFGGGFSGDSTPARQISPQTSQRIQNIFRNKRSPIKEVIKQKPEPARELLPKKKTWKAKWILPKEKTIDTN